MSNGDPALAPGRGPNVVALSAELLRHGRVIPTAAQIAFTGEDAIKVLSYTNVAGTVTMRARFLDALSQQIIPMVINFPMQAFSSNEVIFKPGLGYLLGANFAPHVTGDAIVGAPPYVIAQITRGLIAASDTPLVTLAQGYSGVVPELAWPLQAITLPSEGAGWRVSRTGTTPAAGAEVHEVVPTFAEWRPVWISFTLVTSATVANRVVRLQETTGATGEFIVMSSAVPQTAGTFWQYNFYVGATLATALAYDQVTVPFPVGIRLLAGDILSTNTIGIQAGDQYSAPHYRYDAFSNLV